MNVFDKIDYNKMRLPSFQEMMVAPAYVKEQYDSAQESIYSTMAEADKDAMFAALDPNSNLSKGYYSYMNDLGTIAESITNKDVPISSLRGQVAKAKAKLNSAVLPLRVAAQVRLQDTDLINRLKVDRNKLVQVDESQLSLDNIAARGFTSYVPKVIDGKEVYNLAADLTKAVSKSIDQDIELQNHPKIKHMLLVHARKGGTLEELDAALNNSKVSPNIRAKVVNMYRNVYDTVIQTFGIQNDEEDRMLPFIKGGMLSQLGESNTTIMQDQMAILRQQREWNKEDAKDSGANPELYPLGNRVPKANTNSEEFKKWSSKKDKLAKFMANYVDPKTGVVDIKKYEKDKEEVLKIVTNKPSIKTANNYEYGSQAEDLERVSGNINKAGLDPEGMKFYNEYLVNKPQSVQNSDIIKYVNDQLANELYQFQYIDEEYIPKNSREVATKLIHNIPLNILKDGVYEYKDGKLGALYDETETKEFILGKKGKERKREMTFRAKSNLPDGLIFQNEAGEEVVIKPSVFGINAIKAFDYLTEANKYARTNVEKSKEYMNNAYSKIDLLGLDSQ